MVCGAGKAWRTSLILCLMVHASLVARSLGESFGRFIVLAGVLGTRAGRSRISCVVRWAGGDLGGYKVVGVVMVGSWYHGDEVDMFCDWDI